MRVDFVYTLTMLSSGKTLGLVGAGSFGRECIPIAESMMAKLLSKNVQITNLIFVEIQFFRMSILFQGYQKINF